MSSNKKKVCTIIDCPERHRCLDIETPTYCAVYRAIIQQGLKIVDDKKCLSKA